MYTPFLPVNNFISKISFSLRTEDKIKKPGNDKDNILVASDIFKVNNRNTRTSCEIRSKLAIMSPNDNSSYKLIMT